MSYFFVIGHLVATLIYRVLGYHFIKFDWRLANTEFAKFSSVIAPTNKANIVWLI